MNLDNAVKAHAEWKLKLRSAISKRERIDAISLARDNCCELGRWLHGEGRARFGSLARFDTCMRKHATFHTEAGRVARVINDGDYEAAEKMLEAGGAYARASGDAGAAIVQLKREVEATPA